MEDTVTIKVRSGTRDRLLELCEARCESADQIMRASLSAMRYDEGQQLATAQARAIATTPVDRAEIASIRADLATLNEG